MIGVCVRFASPWGQTGVTLDKTLFPEVRGENEQAKWEMSMPSCNEKGLVVASAGGYVKVKKNGKEYRGKMHRGYWMSDPSQCGHRPRDAGGMRNA